MSFKIIGINVLSSCDPLFTKVLNKEQVYQFYQNYEIAIDGDSYSIKNTDNSLDKLYKLTGKKEINISAIVGKNGSGKSTLVELLYQAVYNISCIKGILYNEELEDYLSKDDIKNYINLDIIYEVDSKYFFIRIVNYDVMIMDISSNKLLDYDDYNQFFESFCYTIAVNYSLHSLNEKHLGSWVKNIFHKNDAYQTPIVINPYRDFGKINISREEYLVNSRLIANILSNSSTGVQKSNFTKSLLNGKRIKQLNVTLNREKLNLDKTNETPIRGKKLILNEAILSEVYEIFLGEPFYDFGNEQENWAHIYILNKIESIVQKYPAYFTFQPIFKRYKTSAIGKLIIALLDDKSHITFKLRQAIYYLKNPFYREKGGSFILDIDKTSKELSKLSEEHEADLIELIPPPFFNIEIDLGEKGSFESFSSGEKQKVFTLSTVIYHLINLNSVNEENRSLITYRNINLVFDEVELYFHPEFQRTYITDLIDIINKTELENISGINCLFITHSPFILSDIPISNILFLNEEGMATKPYEQTFGANIHDLLKNNFFLENGFYGEFAKTKIEEVIEFIKYKSALKGIQFGKTSLEKKKHEEELSEIETDKIELDNDKFYLSIIETIGEPVIRVKLKEMYLDTLSEYEKNNWIDNEIERLKNLKS